MAVENFTELLHKLKDIHEQELEGLQQKVLELTNKKNCDAKRLEELYNRNQQLREQHKMLTENIKQLENMLRAGLCDRCTVTQEMAKKRQQDFESSHLQNLQHISILMGEISALMKENESLREEVKSLRGRIEHQNGYQEEIKIPEIKQSPERTAHPPSLPILALENDQTPPKFATSPSLSVKAESERSQSSETLGEREEASAHTDRGFEHKLPQGWSATPPFESSKPTPLVPSKVMWKERRASSMESLDPRQSPTTPPHLHLLKNNLLFPPRHSEKHPAIVAVPLRPHPVKTAPPALPWLLQEQTDWVTAISAGTSGIIVHPNQSDSCPTIIRFPNLVSSGLESVPPPQSPIHPRPLCQPPRSVFEQTNSKNKRTATISWTGSKPERIFGENLREGEVEVPLDLSSAGVTTIKETEADSASSSSSSPPAPLSSPSSAQSASSPQSDPQTGEIEEAKERQKEKGDEEKNKNVNADTENLKVPTLTISLRPVVVLEALKTAAQKEQNTEEGGRLQKRQEAEGNKQSVVRKRSSHSPEVPSRRPLKEKRMRMTEELQGPNHGDTEQG